jgi:lipopolysaccharide heptosyltransferase II
MSASDMRNKKRILIFNVNWLGDVVLSIPFIRAVRENYPDSFIASIIPERCKEILEGCPYLDEVIYFDEHTTNRGLLRKWQFIIKLRKKKFDTALLIHRSFTRTLICYLAGIKNRIGYYTRKRSWFLTKKIKPLPKNEMHRADYYLGILEGAGLRINSKEYEFFIEKPHRTSIEDKLKEAGLRQKRFAVLHPGANEPIRRWPVENFVSLARRISEEFGLSVVVSGSTKDIPLGNKIEQLSCKKIINLCGKTSLKELAALFEKADFVVCGDTGPMHIASAVGTFVICLFGTASPKITSPRGKGKYVIIQKDVGCIIPCRKLDCEDNRCMKAITIDDVLGVIEKLFPI